ncbi:type III-A CRISPR-associated protein Csm2 [Treponema sp. TIM-1]|uniref:type III-A CRISPR-associated protein Csm2 n=1 Tax=Treponema sp. TIM-1 TaxID=2898417 RepID=UPI00397ECC12
MDYGNQDNRDNRGQHGRHEAPLAPKPVTIDGFYTADKKIKPDLFDKTAREIGESFYFYIKDFKIGVSITQLRRLFDEVKRYDQILEVSPDQWEAQLPYIRMIKSKVSYTVAKAIKQKLSDKETPEKKVYKNLASFIIQGIDLVKELKDYHVFVSLFEAVYGFYYEKAPKSRD